MLLTGVVNVTIDTQNYVINLIRRRSYSFIHYLIPEVISSNQLDCFLMFSEICKEEREYQISL